MIVSASCLPKFTLIKTKKNAMATLLVILWNLGRANSPGEES